MVSNNQIVFVFIFLPLFSHFFFIKGWVHNFRKQSKRMLFIDLRDGSSNEHLQVTVDVKTQPQIPGIGYGDAVVVSGEIGTAPRGHLELRAENLEIKGNPCGPVNVVLLFFCTKINFRLLFS